VHGSDLLPIAFTPAMLDTMVRHVTQVQERLRRRLLLENPSTYVEFAASTMGEADFLDEVVRRTGCGLLLDRLDDGFTAMTGVHAPQASGAIQNAAAIGGGVMHVLRGHHQARIRLEIAVVGEGHPQR
jgi:hypothetical protein